MDLQECITFANENPICYMATIDGDQPRVRALLQFKADDSGFYYLILSMKRVFDQLKKNPKTEVCYFNNPSELADSKMMRITGKLELLDDDQLKEEGYKSRAFLEQISGRSLKQYIEIFRLSTGEAVFWTLKDAGGEREITPLKF